MFKGLKNITVLVAAAVVVALLGCAAWTAATLPPES